jgi:hypothetical protein
MNDDELRLLLLGPALESIDPELPRLVLEAYRGDDDAMLEISRILLKVGRAEQAKRVLEILERTRGK